MKRVRLILIVSFSLMILNIAISKEIVMLEEQEYKKESLLRLHVIANSNSLQDQGIKRRVRNKIISSTNILFKDTASITEASKIVEDNKEYLINLAKAEIKRADKDYQVRIKVAETYFPKRTYGSVTLDQGNYQAVNIIIGEGKGENWWCVLFPPLCFVDSIDSIEGENREFEKEFEFSSLESKTEENVEKLDVKFKFKLLEYSQQSPNLMENFNLAKIFSFGK